MGALAIACAAGLALMYLPGYLFFRAIRFSRLVALICAPLLSCAAFGFLPVLYGIVGIPCSLATVAGVPLLVCAALAAASSFAQGWKAPEFRLPQIRGLLRPRRGDAATDWALAAAYVFMGILVCRWLFYSSLGAPDAFFSRYDNQTHLNLAQAFADSGYWSSLHPSRYAASPAFENPYDVTTGFYPACWHAIVAMMCLLAGAKVTVASNALTVLCAAVVFPSGMFLLIRSIFPENRTAQLAGALVCVSFATYPWVFPIKGPTLPNMLGFALMIPFMAVFIAFLQEREPRRYGVRFGFFAGISFLALTLSHTNALFTAFVFLAAYGGHYLKRRVEQAHPLPGTARNRSMALVLGLYLLGIAAFWAFCLNVPVLQGVVGYQHVEDRPLLQALRELLFLRLTINANQYLLAAICLAGAVACLRRRIWWLLVPAGYMAAAYVVSRIGAQPWLTLLVGLWYSLPYRVGACLCIFLMPVAALGLSDGLHWLSGALARLARNMPAAQRAIPAAGCAAFLLLFVFSAYPKYPIGAAGFEYESPIASVGEQLRFIYGQDANRVYGAEEVAFVDKAMEMIPEGALVLNQPNDGSVFAYGVNHLNAYYRGTLGGGLSDDGRIIRKKLYRYTVDGDVREAVERTGAEYLILLDVDTPYEKQVVLPQYTKEKVRAWAGLVRIDDDTPGFTVLLSEGDMRLYRIG